MTGRVREIGFFHRPAKKDWVQVFQRWNAPMFCTCRMLPLRSFPVVSARGFFGARFGGEPLPAAAG